MTTARSVSIFGATLAMLLMAMPASAQTTLASVLADVPTGTYSLTFTEDAAVPDNNPHANGDVINFILAANGRLCTDDLSLTGAQLRTAPDLAVEWRNDLANSRFYMRAIDNDPDPAVENYVFQDIQFLSATNVLFGVFSLAVAGDYSATTGSCGASSDPTDSQIDTLLGNAETAFPALFPQGPFTFTQKSGTYTYRFYDSTSIYLAVSAGQVYARGGGYGGAYQPVGSFTNLNSNINNIIRPASVREFFVGTYRTEMSDTQPFSTIADGTDVTYAINTAGQLCLSTGATLNNPVFINNDINNAVWRDDAANVSYRLLLTSGEVGQELDAAEGLLQVYSSSGQRFGELSGERISLEPLCATLDPAHPDNLILDQIERLFELAEQIYPEYVTFGPTVRTQRTTGYTFRYYTASNVSIAVRNGLVYTNSGMPDFSQPTLGTLNQVFIMLGQSTRDFLPAPTLVGTYDVLVSNANPLFRLPNNSRIRLVIAASGSLCIDNITLNNPTTRRASPSDFSWTNIQAGINAYLTLGGEAGSVDMALISSRGENLANLQGQRVNLLATCPQPVLSVLEIDTANELFRLAELRYPQLFSTSLGSSTRSTGGSITRHYPETGITVSVTLNEVFVRGGDFGAADYFVGSVGNLVSELRASPTDQAASLPISLPGTYSMVVSGANPFAPFSNNSEVRMVISNSGDLCLNNAVMSNPRSSYRATDIARWTNTAAGFDAMLNLSQSAGPLALELTSTAGNSLGTLAGTRISGETFCSATALDSNSVQQINNFFALAEQRYAEYFPTSVLNLTRNAGGAMIRQYPDTGITITAVNGQIYIRGGVFGNSDFDAGAMTTLANQWQAGLSQQNTATSYSVQVTGTATVVIAGMAAVNRQINIITTATYRSTELADSALQTLAATLLAGEIQTPDSIIIRNVVRSGATLSFSAELIKTTVVGSSTSRRSISANFNLQAQ